MSGSLVDVPGFRVGQVTRDEPGWLTGTTVVLAPPGGAVGGVDVRGGGPGTRETDLLDPRNAVERVDAVVLSGGSALGLAAADGVARALLADGVGYPVPGGVVPIVPAAILFDLGRGGVFDHAPDASFGALAYAAARSPAGLSVASGGVGAGTGAVVGGLKGGVGTASTVLLDGTVVAALVVVNAVGSVVDPATGRLWAAPYCLPADLAGLRDPAPDDVAAYSAGSGPSALATTIGVIATDATLTKAQCARVASQGHDGLARAIRPVHTMFDGDTLFALASCERAAPDPLAFHHLLGAAGDVVTRAVARGVLAATSAGGFACYREAFPSAVSAGSDPADGAP